MSRYARHTDTAHRPIVNALRAMGCTVEPIHGSAGTPDLVVGCFGINVLVEVKSSEAATRRKGATADAQAEWHARWRGRKPIVVVTLADCEALVSRMRGEGLR